MDATRSFITGFLLLFLLGFHPSASHPVSLSPAKELASMEELLERLEEKIALMEDLQGSPEYEEAETPREDGLRFSEGDSGPQMMGPRVEAVPFISDRTSVLKRMRGLQAAKSTRESGCFGRRLDRIGSVSGMGCRGSRRD